jgi:hypothetical protein
MVFNGISTLSEELYEDEDSEEEKETSFLFVFFCKSSDLEEEELPMIIFSTSMNQQMSLLQKYLSLYHPF